MTSEGVGRARPACWLPVWSCKNVSKPWKVCVGHRSLLGIVVGSRKAASSVRQCDGFVSARGEAGRVRALAVRKCDSGKNRD